MKNNVTYSIVALAIVLFLSFLPIAPNGFCVTTALASVITNNPGLKEAGGLPHSIPPQHVTTGRVIKVTDYFTQYGGSLSDDGVDDRPAIQAAFNDAKPGDTKYSFQMEFIISTAPGKVTRAPTYD